MIIIVDHFSQAPGEKGNNRFNYIANLLTDRGHEVEIITSNFSHISKRKRNVDPVLINDLRYKYTMLEEPIYKKNICIKRILSHFVFSLNLQKYLESKMDIQLIYVAVPSLDVADVVTKYARHHSIPVIVDIQDIWPEAFELVLPKSILTKLFLMPLKFKANRIYKSADYIVAVSKSYLSRGQVMVKPGNVAYLGTDLLAFDSIEIASVPKNSSEVWVAYVGTLGSSYNVDLIIQSISSLKSMNNIRFKVFGDGPDIERLKLMSIGLPIDFLGRLDYSKMVSILKLCDIAVNPIKRGAAQSIINKHADYLASGLPIISTQESIEFRELLEAYSFGINCNADSLEDVCNALQKLIENKELRTQYGLNARKAAEELFDRNLTYHKIIMEIESRITV